MIKGECHQKRQNKSLNLTNFQIQNNGVNQKMAKYNLKKNKFLPRIFFLILHDKKKREN